MREKLRPANVVLDNIEDVDFIWSGQPYRELTSRANFYDWIIASHVVEHTPDLIGFLNECASVLKDDGVLALAVPDKRRCFDFFRPISGLGKVIDQHLSGPRTHSPGTLTEFLLNCSTQGGQIAWDKWQVGEFKMSYTLEDAAQALQRARTSSTYEDAHNWVFTPHSFRLLMQDLYQLKMIELREVNFHATPGCEFYIFLSKNGTGPSQSRLELLKVVEAELAERGDLSRAFGGIPEFPSPQRFGRHCKVWTEKVRRCLEKGAAAVGRWARLRLSSLRQAFRRHLEK